MLKNCKTNPARVIKIRIWLHSHPELIAQLVMIFDLTLIVLEGML